MAFRIKCIFLLMSCCFLVFESIAQINQIDSLKKEIQALSSKQNTFSRDTTLVVTLNILSREISYQNPDTAIILAKQGLEISERRKYTKGIARSNANLGVYYYFKGEFPLSLSYYFKALKMDEKLGNKVDVAKQLGNIGLVYYEQGDFPKALEFYFKSLKVGQELGLKSSIASDLGNIGIVYNDLGRANSDPSQKEELFNKSLEYYLKALSMNKELENKNGIAAVLGNIGVIYMDKADAYPNLPEKRKKELLEKDSLSFSEPTQSYYKRALDYYFKALEIKEELGDKIGIAINLGNIGTVYTKIGRFAEAGIYLDSGLAISNQIGILYYMMQFEKLQNSLHESLARFASDNNRFSKAAKHYQLALKHYKQYTAAKDSIYNEEKSKSIGRLEASHEFDKQQAVKDAEHLKDLGIQIEKKKKQQIISYSATGALLLVIGFLLFVFNRLKVTRKQKAVIEEQKQEVEQAHKQLEEKNKEVMDSIHYAKRIQDALLKSEEQKNPHLPEHFILFKPKNIVSGDFYWILEKQQYLYLTAADCTGHGVPGAFLTMLGTSFLNEINAGESLLAPAEILNRLRKRIINELSQTGAIGQTTDGMDMSLIRLDLQTNELEFAGANNPLYLMKNGVLKVIKGDKQPIGYTINQTPFTNHKIQLKKGDCFSIFSDGYADQFGGPKGKKFKYKAFQELLVSIMDKAMYEQKEIIDQKFEQWKGELEQVDDVCVIGVRV